VGGGLAVRALRVGDAPHCDAIVAGLPEWFGNDEGIEQCRRAVRTHEGLVADAGEELLGFLTFERLWPETAEITWLAVRRESRRRGVGRALVHALEERLEGVELIAVKTLSSKAQYEPYEQTRAFYSALGFLPVQELDIWGDQNPCLLMARPRRGAAAPPGARATPW
jgi:ribosomal protein S18 acetylase RimI-like enzyme